MLTCGWQRLLTKHMNRNFYIEDGKDHQQVWKFLDDKLYDHNATALNKHDGSLFSKVALSETNDIIGGICGWTWASACEIVFFWVDRSARHKGIGKELLQSAEEEAKKRDCSTILVRSFSFQAPGFYVKFGYRIEHIIENFPPGHLEYFLLKQVV